MSLSWQASQEVLIHFVANTALTRCYLEKQTIKTALP